MEKWAWRCTAVVRPWGAEKPVALLNSSQAANWPGAPLGSRKYQGVYLEGCTSGGEEKRREVRREEMR